MSSYTLRYGLTYEEWVAEKAKRIRDCLILFYIKAAPIDLQVLVERVYRERLWGVSKEAWMPVGGCLTDQKPSPFMKNFVNYLFERLALDGYVAYGWVVEARDGVRAVDVGIPSETLTPPPASVAYVRRVVRVPSLEYLEDLCTYKDPMLEASWET
jgi:hypothetical protein